MITEVLKAALRSTAEEEKELLTQAFHSLKILAAKAMMMSGFGLWISVPKLSFDFTANHHNVLFGPGTKRCLSLRTQH